LGARSWRKYGNQWEGGGRNFLQWGSKGNWHSSCNTQTKTKKNPHQKTFTAHKRKQKTNTSGPGRRLPNQRMREHGGKDLKTGSEERCLREDGGVLQLTQVVGDSKKLQQAKKKNFNSHGSEGKKKRREKRQQLSQGRGRVGTRTHVHP